MSLQAERVSSSQPCVDLVLFGYKVSHHNEWLVKSRDAYHLAVVLDWQFQLAAAVEEKAAKVEAARNRRRLLGIKDWEMEAVKNIRVEKTWLGRRNNLEMPSRGVPSRLLREKVAT